MFRFFSFTNIISKLLQGISQIHLLVASDIAFNNKKSFAIDFRLELKIYEQRKLDNHGGNILINFLTSSNKRSFTDSLIHFADFT